MSQTLQILLGDCLTRMRELPEGSIGALVCDPPYGLEFQGHEWDKIGVTQGWQFGGGFSKPGIGDRAIAWPSFSGNTPHGTANPTCEACGGRLRGKKRCACEQPVWKPLGAPRIKKSDTDGFRRADNTNDVGRPNVFGRVSRTSPEYKTGISSTEEEGAPNLRLAQALGIQAWHKQWLTEAFRVLQAGGVAKVFSATRTFHRLAAAMEEVGFVLEPMEAWTYMNGFPKSMNVASAVDKLQGVDPAKELEIQGYLRQSREARGLSRSEVDKLVFGGSTRYSWVEGRGGDTATYLPTPEEWVQLKAVLEMDDRYDAYIKTAIPSRENRSRADGGKSEVVGTVEGDFGYQKDGERWEGTHNITEPKSEEAKQFQGFGTCLKPSWEPFLVGRKPTLGE